MVTRAIIKAKEAFKKMDIPLKRIREDVWEVPQSYKSYMRTPARIYAAEELLDKMKRDLTLQQTINVASLPGIEKYSMVMPDGHQGYGFPIGGVAATDFEEGVISPGGVGYDINCGVRLVRTNLREKDIRPRLSGIVDGLFDYIPSGLGLSGKLRLSFSQLDEVLRGGSEWCVENGYGWEEDVERTEDGGRLKAANPNKIDEKSRQRGAPQLGTLGSGNHFLEVQVVDELFDERLAKAFGIEEKGQVIVLIHTGGRGFSHGVCSYYLRRFEREMSKDPVLSNILSLERELACAYLRSETGMDYFEAMSACANYAFANRQLATHWVRKVFEDLLRRKAEEMEIQLVYDIAHNIAKEEEHVVEGTRRKLCVHRKGATRAFPAGDERLPHVYRSIGQPVLIPGSMGTRSFLAVGTERAKDETFGSCAHGSGREMSRTAAMRKYKGSEVKEALERRNIVVKARERSKGDVRRKRGIPFDRYGELAEEISAAYKDPEVVLRSCEVAGIAKKVAAFRPIAVIKG